MIRASPRRLLTNNLSERSLYSPKTAARGAKASVPMVSNETEVPFVSYITVTLPNKLSQGDLIKFKSCTQSRTADIIIQQLWDITKIKLLVWNGMRKISRYILPQNSEGAMLRELLEGFGDGLIFPLLNGNWYCRPLPSSSSYELTCTNNKKEKKKPNLRVLSHHTKWNTGNTSVKRLAR
jgi:hypothetical protein